MSMYGKKFIGGNFFDLFRGKRNTYPPGFRKLKSEIGDMNISEIRICRKPVDRNITNLLNVLTLGKLNEIKGRLNYDELFHLYLFMQLENGKWIRMEKNQVLNLQYYNFDDPKAQCIWVDNMDPNKKYTVNNLLAPLEKNMGDELYQYNGKTNNCQVFVRNVLQYAGLLTPRYKDFIMQDAGTIVNNLGVIPEALMNIATDAAALIDRAVYGSGVMPDVMPELNILPYPMPIYDKGGIKFVTKKDKYKRLLKPEEITYIGVKLDKSKLKTKKYKAYIYIEYNDGTYYDKTINFGSKGMPDYTIHKDDERKARYIKRMTGNKKNEHYNILTPAFWSMWLLWNKKTMEASINDVHKKFGETYPIQFDYSVEIL